jgi:hypothetical protein
VADQRRQYGIPSDNNIPPLHAGCTFSLQIILMKGLTINLTARMFLALAATALQVVAVMAIMIAISMRDGFSRYLLQGEINRFDDWLRR